MFERILLAVDESAHSRQAVPVAVDIAKKSKGNTASSMMQILESRLDNVLRRLGVGRTIWQTRQIVNHVVESASAVRAHDDDVTVLVLRRE